METVQSQWKFYLFEGIIFILLGLFTLGSPQFIAFSIEFLLGAVLLIGGVVQGFRAFKADDATAFFMSILSSAVFIITGLLLFAYPLVAVVTLTLLLAIYFFVDGIIRTLYAVSNWSMVQWRGYLLTGILSLILAFLIWSGWPGNSAWFLGIYFGIYFLLIGIILVSIAFQVKKLPNA